MSTRIALDVTQLPPHGFDTRSPLWWGNTLLLVIETTMLGLLVASYFYIRQNFDTAWPPPQPFTNPPQWDTRPVLTPGTLNLVLLLASGFVMLWVDRSARRMDQRPVLLGTAICIAAGLIAIGLRFHEFQSLHFEWDDNAYASIAWTILGMHLLHLIIATGELSILLIWCASHTMDEKHALDTTLAATYWYWIAGIWVILYGVVYWAPRWL